MNPATLHTPSPRKRWLWLAIALAALLLLVLAVFLRQPAQSAEATLPADEVGPKPSMTITVARPSSESLALTLQANGNISAWQEASVGAEVNGLRLSLVNVNVGDVVRKGQVLAVFANETTHAESLHQAEASYENAKAD